MAERPFVKPVVAITGFRVSGFGREMQCFGEIAKLSGCSESFVRFLVRISSVSVATAT